MRNMRLSNLFMETWLARKRASVRIRGVKPTDKDQEAGNESVSALCTVIFPSISVDN